MIWRTIKHVPANNSLIKTGSIMHYDAYAFAKNRNYPTITSKKTGQELGQRQGFSNVGFIATVINVKP